MDTLPIGSIVIKKSFKPFKSGNKFNTVAGYVDHPILHKPCYTFEEDDSYVEIRLCKTLTMNSLIDKFIVSGNRNEWLIDNYTQLYIRVSHRMIGQPGNQLTKMIDIANIEVMPQHRSRGIFTNIRLHVESFNLPVYIESVLNDKLAAHLLTVGYSVSPYDNSCYIKYPHLLLL